jgi:hypothetical protein
MLWVLLKLLIRMPVFVVCTCYVFLWSVGHKRSSACVCICCCDMQTLNTTYLILSYLINMIFNCLQYVNEPIWSKTKVALFSMEIPITHIYFIVTCTWHQGWHVIYIHKFTMSRDNNRLLYGIFHITRHIKPIHPY